MNSNSSRNGAKASLLLSRRRKMVASLKITSRAMSGIEPHQRRDRIQSVEQEVRIDLVLQRLHAGVQQKAFLFFQLDLNAHAVENLQLDSDRCHHARRVDRAVHPVVVGTLDAENDEFGREISAPIRVCTKRKPITVQKNMICQSNRRGRGRLRRIMRKMPSIDERRERPDIILIDRHGAQLAGEKTRKHIERHRGPLAVQQRGYTHQHAAQRSGPASADHSQQKRSFKTHVAGLETLLRRFGSRRQP